MTTTVRFTDVLLAAAAWSSASCAQLEDGGAAVSGFAPSVSMQGDAGAAQRRDAGPHLVASPAFTVGRLPTPTAEADEPAPMPSLPTAVPAPVPAPTEAMPDAGAADPLPEGLRAHLSGLPDGACVALVRAVEHCCSEGRAFACDSRSCWCDGTFTQHPAAAALCVPAPVTPLRWECEEAGR